MKVFNKIILGLIVGMPLCAMEYNDDSWMKEEDEDALLNATLTPSTPRTPLIPNTPANQFGTFDLPTEIEKSTDKTEEADTQKDADSTEPTQEVQPNKKVKVGSFYPYEKIDNHLYCLFCDRNTDSIEIMKAHINTDHAEQAREWRANKNKCTECGKDFEKLGRLKEHMASHTKTKEYACNQCNKAFAYKSGLRSHKRANHLGETSICSVCKKPVSRKHLTDHMNAVHSNQQLKCEPCDKEFTSVPYYKQHIKGKKHIERMLILQNTGELPPLPKKRKTPPSDSEKVEEFACGSKECKAKGIVFSSPLELRAHKVSDHIETQVGLSPHYCTFEECYEVCPSKSGLEVHMRKHTGEKPFPCEICNTAFSTLGSLTQHGKSKAHGEQLNRQTNAILGGYNEETQ